jgi:excisionase family DNA binding protein
MRTIKETAEITGLTPFRVRQLCISGEVPALRCGKKWLCNVEKLVDYLNAIHVPSTGQPQTTGKIRRISE